jgi:uncharacterized OB-fold protein
MSLVKCKECGEAISSKTRRCPKCGAPTTMVITKVLAVLVAVTFVYLIHGYLTGTL